MKSELDEIKGKVDGYKSTIAELTSEFNSLSKTSENLDRFNELKSQMEQLRDEMLAEQEAYGKKKAEIETAIDDANAEVKTRTDAINAIKDTVEKRLKDYEQLYKEREQLLQKEGITALQEKLKDVNLDEMNEQLEKLQKAYEQERENAIGAIIKVLKTAQETASSHKELVAEYTKAYTAYENALEDLAGIEVYKSIYSDLNKDLPNTEIGESFVDRYGWLDKLTTDKAGNPIYSGAGSIRLDLDVDFVNYLKKENAGLGSTEVFVDEKPLEKIEFSYGFEELNPFKESIEGLTEGVLGEIGEIEMIEIGRASCRERVCRIV